MGKKYKVLAGRGTIIDIQEGKHLWDPLIDAIIDADFNRFSKALTKFIPLWSADEDCHAASKIKDQFGENFNKLKIRLYDGKSFVELTPLQLAAKSGNTEIINFLLRNSSEPQALLNETIQVKMQEKDQEVALNNKEINGFNYVSGSTALHLALEQEHFPAVKLLLDNNTNPKIINQANVLGYPPIFLAAVTSRLDIVDLFLAKGAERTIQVNGMNFAAYARRDGANVNLIGGTFTELEKRLSSDFKPDLPEHIIEKPTNKNNVEGLNKALNYIEQAKQDIAAKNQVKVEEQQKSVNLQNQLVMLEKSIQSLAILIAQARLELAKRKIKNASDPLIEQNENRLLTMEDRTNAIIRKFCDSAKRGQLYDSEALILEYKTQMYANLSALSEYPALEKWLWRGLWAVITIGLVVSGAGIAMLAASVSFEAALLAVISFGAMKSAEAVVIPVALIVGAVATRYTESWNNKAGKRSVKEVTHNLKELHAVKAAPAL